MAAGEEASKPNGIVHLTGKSMEVRHSNLKKNESKQTVGINWITLEDHSGAGVGRLELIDEHRHIR